MSIFRSKVLTRSRSNIVEPPRSLKQNILQGVPCLQRLVSGYPFELFFVFLIILNCGTMIAQIELTGQRLAYDTLRLWHLAFQKNELFF